MQEDHDERFELELGRFVVVGMEEGMVGWVVGRGKWDSRVGRGKGMPW